MLIDLWLPSIQSFTCFHSSFTQMSYLDKALVEAEVVPDGVLPALLVAPVVGKVLDDELVDAVQGQALLRALHGNINNGHTTGHI